jgi:hypothetical protein
MTIDWKGFDAKYQVLAGTLAGDFHDSESVDDENNARNTRTDLPADERMELLSELLTDAHKLMENLAVDWQVMAEMANRPINSLPDARAWLTLVMVAWQDEVTRLQKGDAAP